MCLCLNLLIIIAVRVTCDSLCVAPLSLIITSVVFRKYDRLSAKSRTRSQHSAFILPLIISLSALRIHCYAVTRSLASEQNNSRYVVPSHAPQSAVLLNIIWRWSWRHESPSWCVLFVLLECQGHFAFCILCCYQIQDGIYENAAL